MQQGQVLQEVAPQMTKLDAIFIMLGQEWARANEAHMNLINSLIKEHPDWSAVDVMTMANRTLVTEKIRDGMQIAPGVVVANQAVMGQLTRSINGDPGVISRDRASYPTHTPNPTNAVSFQGGDRPQFTQLQAER